MLAIGAGGLDVAVAMGGGAYYLTCPKVVGVKLNGKLPYAVAAKDLELQKLQHGGGERLADAVDLIEEEDALLHAGLLHQVIDRGDDLAHRVFRDAVFLPAVVLFGDEGQTDGALARVVGHGIAHQSHAQLLGDLLHDGSFADARRAHQKNRALTLERDLVFAELVLGKIGGHGIFDLLLCLFDVHTSSRISSGSSVSRMAQGGTSYWLPSFSRKTKAVS